ncbi:CDP-glycerol glycerophosphotransferase family protein [Campylobacter lanienae]|uniref:CDP-glycerol glycerophosphotransferase family protein n=1 Tax=Campylobacter lanienae TaxID=75658 RepID=UPI000BB40CA6|nr:CDP-glycerol glycerophosphotransferase family protein [Campylobacter lanienae]
MLNPLFNYYFSMGALYYHRNKNYQKALDCYIKANSYNKNNAKCIFKIGMCYFKMQDWNNAKTYIQNATALNPNQKHWKKQLDQSQNHIESGGISRGKLWWKEVEDLKDEIATKGGNFVRYKNLAIALEMMLRFKEAAQAYSQALKTLKDLSHIDAEYYYKMGYCYEKGMENQSDLDLAKEFYEKAISIDEKLESNLYGIGVFHQNKGLWIEANKAYLEYYKNNISINQDDNMLYKIAMSFDMLYDWENAAIYYEKALEINYHRPYTHYRLGFVYERQKEYKKAAYCYQEAVARNSEHKPYWYYRLGYCLNKLGKFEEANKAFIEQNITLQIPSGVDDTILKNKSFKDRAIYTHYLENTPIIPKTILYETFHGRLMSCNPYAIFLHCINSIDFKDFIHIWVLESAYDMKPEFRKMKNIIVIKRGSNTYLKYLAQSEYLINNTTFHMYFTRREGQKYLNTWHGTPWKSLGKYIKTSFMEHGNTQRNFLQTTHIINPSKFVEDVILKDYDIDGIYNGKTLIGGYPRIDLTLKHQSQLKERFGIKEGEKVLLYAPTFRGQFGSPRFEAQSIMKHLEKLCIMPFKVLFKGHYETLRYIEGDNLDFCSANDRDIDTNELLSIVDVLITDYSSIAFDFMPLDRPIIYFTYDYEEYKSERGLYFDINEIMQNRCDTIDDVINLLSNKEFLDKKNRYIHLKDKFFPYEDGDATKRVVDFFFFDKYDNISDKTDNKKNILFFEGPFMPNGITSSMKNLINNIDQEKYRIFLSIEPNSIASYPERLEQFNDIINKVYVLPKVGAKNIALEESYIENNFNPNLNKEQENILKNIYKREFKRIYADSKFDIVINFEGYSVYWARLFAYGAECKKIIYLHTNMLEEFNKRFPSLEIIFYTYKYYDKLISVSKETSNTNQINLSTHYNIDLDKFDYIENAINYQDIIEKSNVALPASIENAYFQNKFKIFINVARLSIEKDQEKLIYAFKEVNKQYPNTKLIILGDGPLREKLENLIKRLKLKKSIFLLGRISNPYPYLKKADCFVMSSNHEGQPMTLLESLILDKYIIATDIAGNRSVLEKYGGILVHNSIKGLKSAMIDYIKGKKSYNNFNPITYNSNLMNKFYQECRDV